MRSKLDPSQIIKQVYDAVSGTLKTSISSTDISMELDHLDGDSITSHPAKLVASVTGILVGDNGTVIIPAVDVSSLKQIHVHVNGLGSVSIEVSPEDSGSVFYAVGVEGSIVDICARRVRIISTDVVGDVYLVGRS